MNMSEEELKLLKKQWKEQDIKKNVVTHEQFESMKYRIGE